MSASSATTTTFGGGREEDHCWRWRRWQWSTTERRQVAHLDERQNQHLTQSNGAPFRTPKAQNQQQQQ
ncbi:hypothetical protein TYRP_011461 [Tyrophagus putrescentiae]|nr:hypothetical protein TYRP_011461 [Tyrophagus putrescentiae]